MAAETVDRIGEHFRQLHADLLALQVGGLDDGILVGPEMSEAIVEEVEHLQLVFLLERLIERIADLAVHHGVSLGVVLDEVGHQQGAHLWEYGRRRAGRTADRDVADLDRVHDLHFLGEQRAAVEAHVELALAAFVHRLGEEFHGDAADVGGAQDVGEVHLLRRCLGVDRGAAGGQDGGHAGRAGGQDAAAAHLGSDQALAVCRFRHCGFLR